MSDMTQPASDTTNETPHAEPAPALTADHETLGERVHDVTVWIASKVHTHFGLTHEGQTAVLPQATYADRPTVTEVPAAVWHGWLAANGAHEAVTNGMVYEVSREDAERMRGDAPRDAPALPAPDHTA